MDGLLALDLWDVVIEVLRSSKSTDSPTHQAAGNCSRNRKSKPKHKGTHDVDQLSHVDYVTTNASSSQGESQLYIFEDNEASEHEEQHSLSHGSEHPRPEEAVERILDDTNGTNSYDCELAQRSQSSRGVSILSDNKTRSTRP